MEILPAEKGSLVWNFALALLLVAAVVGGFFFGQLWGDKLHNAEHFTLSETGNMDQFRLQGSAGAVDIEKDSGKVLFEVVLRDNRQLPSGSHMEGWLGTAQGPLLSAGDIRQIASGKRYSRRTDFGYNLSKYTKAFVILEFEESPNPGTVIMQGDINGSP